MFAQDRDLLALEPGLFRDVVWIGQRLVKDDSASISGTTLTLSSPDVALDAAGVGAGHVATVDGVSYEITQVLTGTTATISRVRADTGDAVIPPSPATGKVAHVVTFASQIGVVHRQVLGMLGIEPSDPVAPGRPGETDITNPKTIVRVEVLGALYLILSAAASLSGPESALGKRAEVYRRWLCQERQRVAARIDLDGDGEPDVTRRLNLIQLMRG